MEERRLGRYFHAPTETEWQIVEWGSFTKQKNIEDHRLTRRGVNESEQTTFLIVHPNGKEQYLTFTGYLPADLDTLADYWTENESL